MTALQRAVLIRAHGAVAAAEVSEIAKPARFDGIPAAIERSPTDPRIGKVHFSR
jgi:hypothetical protein